MHNHHAPLQEVALQHRPGSTRTAQDHTESATNLPHQLTCFIGRAAEIAEVERLLPTTRLLTLTGPGGVGKTRLALQVAEPLLPRFAGGVWLIDLTAVADPDKVAQAVAQTLGIRTVARRPVLATLCEALTDRHLLIVLDNCEHLVAASAMLVAALLQSCAHLTILATSREALGVGGELIWRVPSLSVPPLASDHRAPLEAQDVAQVGMSEAVQLFLERARAVRPDFGLTPQNAPVLAEICQRLDGIPLAIELAAARMQVLSLEQIATRLDDRFRLLAGGARTALPRQQTLAATLAWSHELLSEPERALFRRASVFAGSWTLEAAEDVCAGGDLTQVEILDRLAQLVNKSLAFVAVHEPQARYRLLETVRQYGQERLEEAGEAPRIRTRHLMYMLALARLAERHLLRAEQVAWAQRLEREFANLRAAFDWALASGAGTQALELASRLLRFWMVRGREAEGIEWLEAALQHTKSLEPTPVRAQALWACGCLASRQSDYLVSRRHLQECLTAFRALGDQRGEAQALCELGLLALYERDLPAACALLEEAMPMLEEAGDRWELLIAAGALCRVAFEQGDYPLARAQMERNVAQARALGNPWQLGTALTRLGELCRFEGDIAQAERCYAEALDLFRQLDNAIHAAMNLGNLAQVAHRRGDLRHAAALELHALRLDLRYQGSKGRVSSGLASLAGIVCSLGHADLAAQVFGAAEALSERAGVILNRTDQAQYNRDLAALRGQLDEPTLQAAWAEGRQLSPEQAVALAEATLHPEDAAPPKPPNTSATATASHVASASAPYPADLTAREVEVLRLLAQGLTNKQIAEQLVLSPKTVSSHLASIFPKIGVTSRSAATRFAFEHRLI